MTQQAIARGVTTKEAMREAALRRRLEELEEARRQEWLRKLSDQIRVSEQVAARFGRIELRESGHLLSYGPRNEEIHHGSVVYLRPGDRFYDKYKEWLNAE